MPCPYASTVQYGSYDFGCFFFFLANQANNHSVDGAIFFWWSHILYVYTFLNEYGLTHPKNIVLTLGIKYSPNGNL